MITVRNTPRSSARKGALLATLLATAAVFTTGAFAQQSTPSTPTAPSASVAQAAPAAPAARSAQGGAKHERMDPAQRMERMKAHRAERMAKLKQKLQLNASQESAWSQYAAAHQPPERDIAKMRAERAEFAKLTTPQRLDRMQARQAERNAMMAKRADATRTFYSALTPEQQKTFDAESMHFGRGHEGHGAHGPRHAQGSDEGARS